MCHMIKHLSKTKQKILFKMSSSSTSVATKFWSGLFFNELALKIQIVLLLSRRNLMYNKLEWNKSIKKLAFIFPNYQIL